MKSALENGTGEPIPAAGRKAGNGIVIPAGFNGPVDELVTQLKPEIPLYVLRPDLLKRRVQEFIGLFPGETMYAVKCNPEKEVVQAMYRSGVKSFDVASLEEVRLVARHAPRAKMYFMHPVKSPEAIRAAYFNHGVRAFVLDTEEELYKILRETDLASDLELFVRMALPRNDSAKIDFASKFGAHPDDAVELLNLSRNVSTRLGLCFHVGTQTMVPETYARGIAAAADVIKRAGVKVDVLDVGGGFPVAYADETPQPLAVYMKTLAKALREHKLDHLPLLAEPGRALVAHAASLIVRVEQRRGDLLYLNDGTYGGLFDAGQQLHTRFPVRLIRNGREGGFTMEENEFRFAGPTCDSLDMMDGPFVLSEDVRTGDWIEIGNMGAYSIGLRSNFNGFGRSATVSLYEQTETATKL